MSKKLLSFEEALKNAGTLKKHLLLGNGFSIAFSSKIFSYENLYKESDFSKLESPKAIFENLKEYDFEKIIKMIEDAVFINNFYFKDLSKSQQEKMLSDSSRLKEVLIETISTHHPHNASELSEENIAACKVFLSKFTKSTNNGYIFTLNYDMLLYWVQQKISSGDGFGNDPDKQEKGELTWLGDDASKEQNIFYLHGALHLFNSYAKVKKYSWSRTGIAIIEQIREGLDKNNYPLFITEGTSEQKLKKIFSNQYLIYCYNNFKEIIDEEKNCLFIHGHSLAENDKHFLSLIEKGRIPQVYISLFGDFDSTPNKEIRRVAMGIKEVRKKAYPLQVQFYDAPSAKVWG